jgi:hypothetical protein
MAWVNPARFPHQECNVSSRDPVPRPGIDVHKYYTLDISSTASAALADIYSFEGSRGMGDPTKFTIQFTHPQRDLLRGDSIGKIASFSIQPPLAPPCSTLAGAALAATGGIPAGVPKAVEAFAATASARLVKPNSRARFSTDEKNEA